MDDPLPGLPAPRRSFAIRVLGVGGAGCNAVFQLASQSMPGVECVVMNTDLAALQRMGAVRAVLLGERSMHGLGAGGEPERGRAAAEEDAGTLRKLCEGIDLVFVVAGMGGGTGTGAAPVVARIAREAGALVIGIVVTPFDCEGIQRLRRASSGLQQLKAVADGVICLPNQRILKLVDDKTTLVDAFKLTNEWVIQGIQGIWRMLSRPGLINVDFADLCSVMRGCHAESSLATSEARGENRVAVALERLFAHPLIDGGTRLADAGQMLVSIAGGPDLTMRDVNHIMEQLRRHAEHAHLIMGASIEEDSRDRIVLTVVASISQARFAAEGASADAPAASAGATGGAGSGQADEPLLREADMTPVARPTSRFTAPPPESTPDMIRAVASHGPSRGRNRQDVWKQGTLNLEIVSKGRFEKSQPTIHGGQDLDIPTFVRRGIVLN